MTRKRIIQSVVTATLLGICIGCNSENKQENVATITPAMEAEAEITTEETPTISITAAPTPTTAPTPTSAPDLAYTLVSYPTVNSDIPDPDIIRVGEVYYMVSTTMNLCPGVPIMKSTDLVHWQIVRYVYDTFASDDKTNLENGKDMYAKGSWAASLRYDEENDCFYIGFNSNDHGFFLYKTEDLENGEWTRYTSSSYFHDPGLFVENGELYVISASGGNCTLQKLSLDDTTLRVTKAGASVRLFSSNQWSLWEGAHVYKIGEYYYVFIIASPKNRWIRTQLCYRSKTLVAGGWEEKVVYQGGSGNSSAGLAQGGVIETQYGNWYAFLFQDRGATGRVPSIVAVEWQEDWPILGSYNMAGVFCPNQSDYASRIYLPEDTNGNQFAGSDEFSYASKDEFSLYWQWNHNPKEEYWSVTERNGYLRLTTDTVVSTPWEAHNSLTQRTIGPSCESITSLSVARMKPGDYAGMAAVSNDFAMVGVYCDEKGEKYLIQANAAFREAITEEIERVETPLESDATVFLKISYDLKGEKADFFYSFDQENWTQIGKTKRLGFSTDTTFMGTRTWLVNYATKASGGSVDFDFYHLITK